MRRRFKAYLCVSCQNDKASLCCHYATTNILFTDNCALGLMCLCWWIVFVVFSVKSKWQVLVGDAEVVSFTFVFPVCPSRQTARLKCSFVHDLLWFFKIDCWRSIVKQNHCVRTTWNFSQKSTYSWAGLYYCLIRPKFSTKYFIQNCTYSKTNLSEMLKAKIIVLIWNFIHIICICKNSWASHVKPFCQQL